MNEVPRKKLIEAIKSKRQAIIDDPRLCEALLTDLGSGASKGEIKALAGVVAARLVSDLRNPATALPMEARITQYTRRLYNDYGFNIELARWAVESWAQVLGVWNGEIVLELRHDATIEFVRIQAGEFLMGSAVSDKDALDYEKPQHVVALDEYLFAKHDVTNAQYAAFVRATRYKTTAEKIGSGWSYTGGRFVPWKDVKGADWLHPRGPGSNLNGKDNHPVVLVSWDDAVACCAWVSQVTGRKVKLPTEAQWEKAARGSDGRLFPWGNSEPDASKLNYGMNVKDTTTVGKYSPAGDSPYGVADMAGNVWQWTSSLYKPYPYDPDDGRDEQTSRDTRVVRNVGFFNKKRKYVRSAFRGMDFPDYCDGLGGFRVVATPI